MAILLDTHVYLWILEGSNRLTDSIKAHLNKEYPRFVSAVSFAEIEIKRSIGKLELPDDYRAKLKDIGLSRLEFSTEDSAPLYRLPFHHKDPFDRMLISQGIVRNLSIATADPIFEQYPVSVFFISG